MGKPVSRTRRRHLTPSGRFEVTRRDGLLCLTHVPTGLPCGRFSHLRYRTFKAVIEGMERVEKRLSALEWARVDRREDSVMGRSAMENLSAALYAEFPNGGWARG